ncbi:hypothetical protein ABZ746_38885 [Streptomyces sp. NPDC020096]
MPSGTYPLITAGSERMALRMHYLMLQRLLGLLVLLARSDAAKEIKLLTASFSSSLCIAALA